MKEDKQQLIDIIEENRESIAKKVVDLEKISDMVDQLIPKQYDYKSRYVLLDRVKSISELHKTILDYRSKLNDIVLSEIKLKEVKNDDDRIFREVYDVPLQKID